MGGGAAAVASWMRSPAAEEGWRLYFAADAAGLPSFAAVSACCRLWERDYDDILTNHYLTALVILDVVACIACWLFGRGLELGALSVETCCILNKPARRQTEITADYVGFDIPDEFVVGYGLDYAGKYRNLPYIGILSRKVYEK
mgnify:CR=1 FL=1